MRKDLCSLLNTHYDLKNNPLAISEDNPDPLLVLRNFQDKALFEEIALISALLSYGSAKQIVWTLKKLDFSLLETSIQHIQKATFPLYRFQTQEDMRNLFIAIFQIIQKRRIKEIILEGYDQRGNVIDGIHNAIKTIQKALPKDPSRGLGFLIGSIKTSPKASSPLKRWNMYLRWMVRKDCIDFGIWEKNIDKSSLILPLDTHTFSLCKKLGLLKRKTYDLQSALLATEALKKFDPLDPIKYDFVLYRLGQEKFFDKFFQPKNLASPKLLS